MSVCKVCGSDAGFMGIICPSCSAERANELHHYQEQPTTDPEAESREKSERELEARLRAILTSTTNEIDGYETSKNLGIVRGSSVRSRHVGSEAVSGLKSIVGGELKGVTKLIADAREQAIARLFRDAESLGANAIIGMRFSTSSVWESAAEVMAYGTAVVVKPLEDGPNETGD